MVKEGVFHTSRPYEHPTEYKAKSKSREAIRNSRKYSIEPGWDDLYFDCAVFCFLVLLNDKSDLLYSK